MSAHRSPFLLALALGLSACTAQAPAPAASADATAAPSASPAAGTPASSANTAAACPDPDFDTFLARFSRDIAVQKKATADPLPQGVIDSEAQPEPRMVNREVPLAKVEWPVIPDFEAARKDGRQVVISTEGGDGRQVLVLTPDTDDQQTYHFAQRPCWTLVRTIDQSL